MRERKRHLDGTGAALGSRSFFLSGYARRAEQEVHQPAFLCVIRLFLAKNAVSWMYRTG